MFTVSHGGLDKQFTSIYAAMRYSRQLWRKNHRSIIWTAQRPLFDSASFKRKPQKAW
jgi:hypothetical protein